MRAQSQRKTVVGQNSTLRIGVVLENQGDYTENLDYLVVFADPNATIKDDEVLIGFGWDIELTSDAQVTMMFNWSLTGTDKDNYTIIASASVVPGETDTVDNNLTGWIIVSRIGDITGPDG